MNGHGVLPYYRREHAVSRPPAPDAASLPMMAKSLRPISVGGNPGADFRVLVQGGLPGRGVERTFRNSRNVAAAQHKAFTPVSHAVVLAEAQSGSTRPTHGCSSLQRETQVVLLQQRLRRPWLLNLTIDIPALRIIPHERAQDQDGSRIPAAPRGVKSCGAARGAGANREH
jgi:hypothetical protein